MYRVQKGFDTRICGAGRSRDDGALTVFTRVCPSCDFEADDVATLRCHILGVHLIHEFQQHRVPPPPGRASRLAPSVGKRKEKRATRPIWTLVARETSRARRGWQILS
eukprot:7694705-Pyramimonas_sp.AAC.1